MIANDQRASIVSIKTVKTQARPGFFAIFPRFFTDRVGDASVFSASKVATKPITSERRASKVKACPKSMQGQ